MPPQEDPAATINMHKKLVKFGRVTRVHGFPDMLADRQTHRRTDTASNDNVSTAP